MRVMASGLPVLAAAIPILVLVVPFAIFCLVDLVRSSQVRYLPKWAWALICLAQTPGGGIIYLSIGRARPIPPGSGPPEPAQRP